MNANESNIAVTLKTPIHIDLAITKNCNHKCIHCYNPWRQSEIDSLKLNRDQINQIARLLYDNKIWEATLTGGEPLFHIETLYTFIEAFNSYGIDLTLNSNLTLMSDEIAKTLTSTYRWHSSILTSLPSTNPDVCDAITQVKGSYQRIINGIRICKLYGIKVGINIVISTANISVLDDIIDFICNVDIDFVSITRAIPPTYDQDNIIYKLTTDDIIKIADTLLEVKRRFEIPVYTINPLPLCVLKDYLKYKPLLNAKCSAGIISCSINAITGLVSACTHEHETYGNIYIDNMEDIWSSMNIWRKDAILHDECKKCYYRFLCGGECRLLSSQKNHYIKAIHKNELNGYIPKDSIISINYEKRYIVGKNVKYRYEDFGGVIQIGGKQCFVTRNIIFLLETIISLQTFSISDLGKIFDITEKFLEYISNFIEMGIIEEAS